MSAAAAKSDFVQVQLTAAGVAFAGTAGVVRVGNGHFDYTWKAGEQVRVLTSEWNKCLKKMQSGGQPIFEVASGSSAPAAQPSLAQLKAEQAQIAAEIAADQAAGQQ